MIADDPSGRADASEDASEDDRVEEAVADAGEAFEWFGRAGWVAKGLLYGLIGILFIQVAIAPFRSGEANQAGAIQAVAERPVGALLVGAIAFGLALYMVWRLCTVVLPGDWTGRALLNRIGYAVSAGAYASLLFTVIGILRRTSPGADTEEDQRVESSVRTVFDLPAGRWIVVVAGILVIGIGVAFAQKGWTRSFRGDISGDAGLESTAIDRLGTVGWIARGISMVLIGALLISAAWQFEPDEAGGLDNSIRQIADHPLGAVLAAIVGVGFIAYGGFAVVSARHQDLQGPTNQ